MDLDLQPRVYVPVFCFVLQRWVYRSSLQAIDLETLERLNEKYGRRVRGIWLKASPLREGWDPEGRESQRDAGSTDLAAARTFSTRRSAVLRKSFQTGFRTNGIITEVPQFPVTSVHDKCYGICSKLFCICGTNACHVFVKLVNKRNVVPDPVWKPVSFDDWDGQDARAQGRASSDEKALGHLFHSFRGGDIFRFSATSRRSFPDPRRRLRIHPGVALSSHPGLWGL